MSDHSIRRFHKIERLSRAVVHGSVAYFSGITADDKSQDTYGQARQILEKADALFKEVGTSKSRLLSTQIWLRDASEFGVMNKAWLEWIDRDNPPARATVGASFALPDIRIEIKFTAAV